MSRFAKPTRTAPQIAAAKRRGPGRPPGSKNKLVHSNVPVLRPASQTPTVINKAGGQAFQMSDKMELVTTAFCGLIRGGKGKPQRMYESEDARMKRIAKLVQLAGPEFTAKLALTLRIQHGQRSITHLLAALVGRAGSGHTWLADFFKQVAVRADDPGEIIACHWLNGGKKGFVPNGMKKGLARAFDKWDAYRLAKYQGGDKKPSLVDVINLVHPKPTERNADALKALVKGTLKNEDTWEAMLSAAGQKGKAKKNVWAELILEEKLGQLALLKNLRNISQECDLKVVRLALEQLRDPVAIKKNGILPMQYLKAYEVLTGCNFSDEIKASIDDAVEIAAGNVPSIGNRVLLSIDESGSMGVIERENASIMAACLLKSNPHADLMLFANTARYETFNRKLPILELMQSIRSKMRSGGTNFNSIFQTANKSYDSIVILSDGEGWMGSVYGGRGGAPVAMQADYERRYGKPVIFSFDLGGDGSLMFREDGIILLAGFSFHVFKLMNILRQDRVKLTDLIDKIEIGKPLPAFGEDDED